jgi:predicted nucleic acid-binding protein
MIYGLDTGFLVAVEVVEHLDHAAARHCLARLLTAGDLIAIAPQVLAEFIHIVTDTRRFTRPLDMAAARRIAEQWWTAREVQRVFPDDAATWQFLTWLQQFLLGRKRLLDTLLAATYGQAGIRSVLTTNPADFAVFGIFSYVTPPAGRPRRLELQRGKNRCQQLRTASPPSPR